MSLPHVTVLALEGYAGCPKWTGDSIRESKLCSADKKGFEMDPGGCVLETLSILEKAAGSLL